MYNDFAKSFYNTPSTDVPSSPQGVGRHYAIEVANDNMRKALANIRKDEGDGMPGAMYDQAEDLPPEQGEDMEEAADYSARERGIPTQDEEAEDDALEGNAAFAPDEEFAEKSFGNPDGDSLTPSVHDLYKMAAAVIPAAEAALGAEAAGAAGAGAEGAAGIAPEFSQMMQAKQGEKGKGKGPNILNQITDVLGGIMNEGAEQNEEL